MKTYMAGHSPQHASSRRHTRVVGPAHEESGAFDITRPAERESPARMHRHHGRHRGGEPRGRPHHE
eukprot:9112598-Pyramimonas_sp.AAC.1